MNYEIPAFGEYSFRSVSREEFDPVFDRYRSAIFESNFDLAVEALYTADEEAGISRLRENLQGKFRLNILVYFRFELVGWAFGVQLTTETFYLVNAGLFSEHRNKGVMSALLNWALIELRNEGFQIVQSKHLSTNNQAIVPVLRAGFVITGLEVNDRYGVLVSLSYFFNAHRREAMEFRSGMQRPSEELKTHLRLSGQEVKS